MERLRFVLLTGLGGRDPWREFRRRLGGATLAFGPKQTKEVMARVKDTNENPRGALG